MVGGALPGPLARALDEVGVSAERVRSLPRPGGEPLWVVPIEPLVSEEAWKGLRDRARETGHWPVLTRDVAQDLDDAAEPVAAVLARANAIEPAAWFRARRASDPEYYDGVERGTWDDALGAYEGGRFTVVDDPGPHDGPLELLLVPTNDPAEVFAHLDWGGWNECPLPEEHVALHRAWHARYGAELVTLSRDVVEMVVLRPPRGEAACMELADEQFLYTGGDLVYQGTEELARLAHGLDSARTWFFWWD